MAEERSQDTVELLHAVKAVHRKVRFIYISNLVLWVLVILIGLCFIFKR